MLWNANNTFGFERIDWERLRAAAVITTVSRYMRHRMGEQGVDALVIPNGLSAEAFLPAEPGAVTSFRKRLQGRTVLAKMARFDPEKRWLGALEIVGQLARAGLRPLLVARGGAEQHGADVLRRARALGLRVRERATSAPGTAGLLSLLGGLESTDVVFIGSHVDPEARRLLFRAAHAVLANSAHEPFGLVGLEAMAAGGLAVTGCTGEDYAVSGQNALVLQTEDAREFVTLFGELRRNPDAGDEIRRAGQRTAREFAWSRVIERNLIPRVELLRAAAQAA
jgi:glycosyltransferase involved in cell wall biosynthesis